MALSANRETDRKDGLIVQRGLAASAEIFKGSLVNLDNAGYVRPARTTSTDIFAGVAYEYEKDLLASAGATKIRLETTGVFEFATSGAAITDVGKPVWITDDETVTLTPGNVFCGIVQEFISTTSVRVLIGPGYTPSSLDWDTCWADAVHLHTSAGEGGALYNYFTVTLCNQDVPISQSDIILGAFKAPFAFTAVLVSVGCSAYTATGSVDVKEAGTTILTAPITPTTGTAVDAAPSDTAIADNAIITAHATTNGSGLIPDCTVVLTGKIVLAAA